MIDPNGFLDDIVAFLKEEYPEKKDWDTTSLADIWELYIGHYTLDCDSSMTLQECREHNAD